MSMGKKILQNKNICARCTIIFEEVNFTLEKPLLPHYLMVRGDREELKKNWEKKMSYVSILNISTDSNIAGSHFV